VITRVTRVRLVAIERCLSGGALLAWPVPIARTLAAHQSASPAWIARILGARLVVQGLVELARPDRRIVLGAATVDSAHAASMIATAALLPTHLRVAAFSAAEAALSAAVGLVLARNAT
jgi:hypothetical protein